MTCRISLRLLSAKLGADQEEVLSAAAGTEGDAGQAFLRSQDSEKQKKQIAVIQILKQTAAKRIVKKGRIFSVIRKRTVIKRSVGKNVQAMNRKNRLLKKSQNRMKAD